MSPEPVLLRVIVGSQAYGVATDQPDTDVVAITVAPPQDLIGLGRRAKATVQRDAADGERSRSGDMGVSVGRFPRFSPRS